VLGSIGRGVEVYGGLQGLAQVVVLERTG